MFIFLMIVVIAIAFTNAAVANIISDASGYKLAYSLYIIASVLMLLGRYFAQRAGMEVISIILIYLILRYVYLAYKEYRAFKSNKAESI